MDRGKPEIEADYGSTWGMMMRTENPLFGTWEAVVVDSGFCMLKGLVGMLANWVYGTKVTKKKRYCPKYCKGDVIEAFLRDKEVGDIYAVCGDLEGQKYKIHCMKEDDCAMKLFGTHGLLYKHCRKTLRTYKNIGETITKICFYPEPMDIHFLYRHQIYDHNNCRNQLIGLDNLWGNVFGRIGSSLSYFLSPRSTPTSSTTTSRSTLRGQF